MAIDPIVLLQAQLLVTQAQQAYNDAQASFLKLKNQQSQDLINAQITVAQNTPINP